MDPIEIEDWLKGARSLRWDILTKRTTDEGEILAHKTGLPADYPWVDGSSLLEKENG